MHVGYERDAGRLNNFEPAAVQQLIYRCAELHVNHIATAGDPFESGSARPLDFGHWSAHKLEQLSEYKIRHGEAVGVGIALDTIYSQKIGLLDEPSAARVLHLLEALEGSMDRRLILMLRAADYSNIREPREIVINIYFVKKN